MYLFCIRVYVYTVDCTSYIPAHLVNENVPVEPVAVLADPVQEPAHLQGRGRRTNVLIGLKYLINLVYSLYVREAAKKVIFLMAVLLKAVGIFST